MTNDLSRNGLMGEWLFAGYHNLLIVETDPRSGNKSCGWSRDILMNDRVARARMTDARVKCLLVSLVFIVLICGCHPGYREDLDYSHNVQQTWEVDGLENGVMVQFEDVFWEADDTISLRELLTEGLIADGRDVLEIGTGTGLLSVLALRSNAKSVIATDINPAAVANARYNAAMLAPENEIDVRQVSKESPGAFSVIGDNEKFDLILSNPPWEHGEVSEPIDHAFYDPEFALMESLLDELPLHLKPGGRCLLAYGHRPAVELLIDACGKRGYEYVILDDRNLKDLDRDFLPGLLIEVVVPTRLLGKPLPISNPPIEEISR